MKTDALDGRALDALESRIGREAAIRLAALFRRAAFARIAELERARETRDLAALRVIAHEWISEGAAIGAIALAAAAKEIETRALAGEKTAFETSGKLERLARAAAMALARRYGEAA